MMNPALIMLLIVAAVFLGFSMISNRDKPVSLKKGGGKPALDEGENLGTQRQPYLVPSQAASITASGGTDTNNLKYASPGDKR